MCGILGLVTARTDSADAESTAAELGTHRSALQAHRGPDEHGRHVSVVTAETARCAVVLVHERLAVVDTAGGKQPLYGRNDNSLVLVANGEIYNHQKIRDEMEATATWTFRTRSDCEVLLALYDAYGAQCVNHVDGIFAFILLDLRTGHVLVARDAIGVNPLYMAWGDGMTAFASEMKCLSPDWQRTGGLSLFPPGHYTYRGVSSFVAGAPPITTRWFTPAWWPGVARKEVVNAFALRTVIEKAVRKRMMCDVPWGILLSGGLDSSIVASIAANHCATRVEEGWESSAEAWWPRPHTFCIGLEGSPDLAAAARVAKHLNTVHHGFTYTVEEGLQALEKVVYHTETFDVTTIRASTPMLLLARKIKMCGVKMVLSGEGADEVFAGYLYFHKAPHDAALHAETVQKVKDLHYFDCLRANKSLASAGVEVRVPFLDHAVLDYAFSIDPRFKRCGNGVAEKAMLRQAFAAWLPDEIVQRQKEQFSDGVGYTWIDSLRAHADKIVTDAQFAARKTTFPINTPVTKEAYLYRAIFTKLFPSESEARTCKEGASVACSTSAAIAWDEQFQLLAAASGGECSGRAVAGVHRHAYQPLNN